MTRTPLIVMVGRMGEGMSHIFLPAVPLFVFIGLLIEMTSMAFGMVAFFASLLDHGAAANRSRHSSPAGCCPERCSA